MIQLPYKGSILAVFHRAAAVLSGTSLFQVAELVLFFVAKWIRFIILEHV